MSLADEIRNRLAGGNVENVLAQQATGKAASAKTKGSSVGQAVAEQSGQSQLNRLDSQSQLQQAGIATESKGIDSSLQQGLNQLASEKRISEQGQNLKFTMAEFERGAQLDESMAKLTAEDTIQVNRIAAGFDMSLQKMLSERKLTEDSLFNNFKRENATLADRKDAANLEQFAFSLRLRDQQYVDQITRIGKMRRLDDATQFREESARLALGDNFQETLKQMGFYEGLYADQRAFEEMLSKISPDLAMQLATAAMKDEATSMIWQGVGTVGGTVANQYGSGNLKFTSTPDPTPDTSNEQFKMGNMTAT